MSSTDKDEDEVRARPFADFIRETARGRAHDELTDGLRELVGRVSETGKKGSLTLTLNLAEGGDGQIVVDHKVTTKLPEFTRPATIFYVDEGNNLVRNDPRQGELFSTLQSVDARDAREAQR